jgi:hypothetical protein
VETTIDATEVDSSIASIVNVMDTKRLGDCASSNFNSTATSEWMAFAVTAVEGNSDDFGDSYFQQLGLYLIRLP